MLQDLIGIKKCAEANPISFPVKKYFYSKFKPEEFPEIVSLMGSGRMTLILTSPRTVEDALVKKN